MDDTTSGRDTASAPTMGTDNTGRLGFCQECGRLLTRDTLRRRDDGVFCEGCASEHTAPGGWQKVHAGAGRPGTAPPGMPPRRTEEPNPAVAACLGFIPGVGAMFNGQYAKSAMHLIVFVILVALADNVYWAFWWLVWGWIFYQAFDAYHTARARRYHLPLPNPFGWNDVGEQMGFGAVAAPPPVATATPPTGTQSAYAGANWAGYVSPQAPWDAAGQASGYTAGSGPAHASDPLAGRGVDNPYTAPYAAPDPPMPGATNVPYAPTYTGVSPQGTAATPAAIRPMLTGTRRFPLGALWLIGLGVVFLLGNLLPSLRLSGRWFAPMLLAALAVWSGIRRLELAQAARIASGVPRNLACALVGPVMLFAVAVLLALQTASILPMRRSWPLLLVTWGMMLLLQRSAATPIGASCATQPVGAAMPPPPTRSTAETGSLGL